MRSQCAVLSRAPHRTTIRLAKWHLGLSFQTPKAGIEDPKSLWHRAERSERCSFNFDCQTDLKCEMQKTLRLLSVTEQSCQVKLNQTVRCSPFAKVGKAWQGTRSGPGDLGQSIHSLRLSFRNLPTAKSTRTRDKHHNRMACNMFQKK